MDDLTAALADAYGLLYRDLGLRLDRVEFLALGHEEWTDHHVERAAEVIAALVDVLRALLGTHRRAAAGGCTVCGSPWPCPVITTLHRHLTDPHRELARQPRMPGEAA